MDDTEYRYLATKDNNIIRVHVETDDSPLHPREDFDNLCKIAVWSENVRGDEKEFSGDAEEFFMALGQKYLTEEQIVKLTKEYMEQLSIQAPTALKPSAEQLKKELQDIESRYQAVINVATGNNLTELSMELLQRVTRIERTKREEFKKQMDKATQYVVVGEKYRKDRPYKGTKEECEQYLQDTEDELLTGDIFLAASGKYSDIMLLLNTTSDIMIAPIYEYTHSGTTISMGNFGDRFDSGQIGWIYIDKATVFKECSLCVDKENHIYKPITEENWRIAAKDYLSAEIKTYDMYIQGDVYGTVEEQCDKDTNEWTQTDSCWGYFCDAYPILDNICKDVYRTVYTTFEEAQAVLEKQKEKEEELQLS